MNFFSDYIGPEKQRPGQTEQEASTETWVNQLLNSHGIKQRDLPYLRGLAKGLAMPMALFELRVTRAYAETDLRILRNYIQQREAALKASVDKHPPLPPLPPAELST